METPEQEAMETPEQEAKETVPIEADVKTNGKQKENEDDSSSYIDEEVEREVEEDVKDCADPDVDEPEHTKFYRFFNAIDKRMTLAVLKNHIYFYGYLAVQALFGQVEIMGYRLKTAEARTVTAARGYYAVSLIPLPSPESLNKAAFKNVLQKLRPHFIEIDMDGSIRSIGIGARVAASKAGRKHLAACDLQTQQLLEVELLPPDVTKVRSVPLFQKNSIWDKVQLRKSSRLMVIGGKDAGKSTLCQFLTNRHIREFGRIVLLDLDIGQPFVHLPETISVSVLTDPILGVGYFAKAQPPSQCLLFGSVNVVSSPVLYIKNVQQLIGKQQQIKNVQQHCEANAELKDVPWIVNTMGYTTGFGKALMAALIHLTFRLTS
ncbi:polynucleotide 5'-hydroxyl-kinase NOL9-like [Anopheles coustani]|uniref:polynucleotide 5'-hydroxyl-kinase NOL9-like n=1 Tax=Anopheles coustani TaxID=139045 RepID=UPI002658071E|nr:polynucleotide 5'-hydroxyl-kinase NOL9-like [Anopheles coustani]